MIIQKTSDLKGAPRFGTCYECRVGTGDGAEIWRITFDCTSVYLCRSCLKRVGTILGKYADELISAVNRCKLDEFGK